ncbi:branched-chain amino acid ABC transporter permease [Plasticicumulans acidivorans]|uniref:Amino acid/amide ABC transporter membrane protein 1 (HAAT family) n=1 Tax=Plasticicumulans acidivorans TaxID=886464 RepID=A0A317MS47_9GAMM|nr:branched-chain amino acid ABC transporter permease [Plasticicumulans acidivorans]PWV59796.1 amino acid/amide ABC transporter membrane protein 1 (HAAT family) [Plasticicumulans acidivorans]
MTFDIAILLTQDGLTNGALYALLALALVLVFAVTRVIFIPQGDFVVLGALTLASLQAGHLPPTLYLLLALGGAVGLIDAVACLRSGRAHAVGRVLLIELGYPLALWALCHWLLPLSQSLWLHALLTLAIVVPLGPSLYRLVFQPLAQSSVLVLLIAAIAVHFALVGLNLLGFGPEGVRTAAFSDAVFEIGSMFIASQNLWIVLVSAVLIVALYLFFERALYGKALLATAFNRTGARLVGISPDLAGRLSFAVAALVGTVAGILMGPITTLYYDSGFLIGLKGFVGAIVGGLASYPLAAGGALLVGLLESGSAFYASAFKEVIVFTLIIPVLLWRSLKSHDRGSEE